jgi:hypothetical protein
LNSFSNMMQYPLLDALPALVVLTYWIPIQIWCNILSWLPCLFGRNLLSSFSKMMQYLLLAALPLPVVVSYWIRIHIWSNIISWLLCLFLWSFLIEFLYKYELISNDFASGLNQECIGNMYWRTGWGAALQEGFPLFLNRHWIRNDHGRRRGSQERISISLESEMEKEISTGGGWRIE